MQTNYCPIKGCHEVREQLGLQRNETKVPCSGLCVGMAARAKVEGKRTEETVPSGVSR